MDLAIWSFIYDMRSTKLSIISIKLF